MDGVLHAFDNIGEDISFATESPSGHIQLGHFYTNAKFLNTRFGWAIIDNLIIFDRPITEAEIQLLD